MPERPKDHTPTAEIGDLLRLHRMMSRNAGGTTGCRGCRWTGVMTPGTDAAWAEWVDHVVALTLPPATSADRGGAS